MRRRTRHALPPLRPQVYLNPPLLIPPSRLVSKARQIKIRPQFAIDSRQQIQIERRGHACRIVVRQQLRRYVLLQVRSQQQSIAGLQSLPHFAQELFSSRAIKIANRAPQEKHQQVIAFIATLCHGLEPFQIRLFVTDHAYKVDLPELLLASRQRRRRDLDREIIRSLPARKRLQYPARFFSASASQLGTVNRSRQQVYNFLLVLLQQSRVRPRQPILWQ